MMAQRFDRHNKQGVLHCITINVRDRVQAFRGESFARAAAEILHLQCLEHPAKLIAYVIMPEHIHAILNPRDGDILRFLAQFKPAVTMRIAEIAGAMQNQRILDWLRMPDGRLHLWQDGKHNFHLYSERLIWQKINYIHTNPIARKLVKTAVEYPYSSFRAMYQLDEEIIVPIDREYWWNELLVE
jgi:REP element-mobilizing transposase RayT